MIERWWKLPLWAHVLGLALVATLAVGATGPGVAYFSDEGAAVVQSQLLARDGSWLLESPTMALDPEGAARPFQHGDYGVEGLAPYAKHPLYPLLLGTVAQGSALGAVALSIVGLVVAAAVSAVLARRVAPGSTGLPRATVWVVGFASPLLFAAGLVVAHTLGAAVAALTVWAAVALVLPLRVTARAASIALAASVGVGCLVAGALRTEAVFLGPAIALSVAVFGSCRPRRRAVVAGLAVLGSAAAQLVDRSWSRSIVGDRLASPSDNPVPSTGTWALDRLHGLYTTVVQAGYSISRGQELVLWLAVAALVGAALAWRLRRVSTRTGLLVGAVGVGLYLLRLAVGPTGSIPGVLVAFPLLAVALVLVDGRVVRQPVAALLLTVTLACVALVVLTQYPIGGGVEWGWRYSTFVLPLAVPPVLWGAWTTVRERIDGGFPLVPAISLLVVLAVAPALSGLRAQATTHGEDRQLASSIREVAAEASTPGLRPVVLSWNRFLPQILFQEFDGYEWVVPARADLATYAGRLAESGVDRVILVGPDAQPAVEELGTEGWSTVATGPDAPYDVVVLQHDPSNVRS